MKIGKVYKIYLDNSTQRYVIQGNNYFMHGDLLALMKTIEAYVTCIRQVATLLGYGEPQILEVFKNTLPTKLYWILFPIDDLRQAVETAKRIIRKEKIDRQSFRQFLSTPIMSIKDNHSRKVSFDTKEEIGDKIDKLVVMIGKLATRDSRSGRHFKP